MIFKVWGKRTIKKRPWVEEPKKDRRVLAGLDPRVRQIAYDRLAILREYHARLSKLGRPKTKKEVIESLLDDIESGIIWPDRPIRSIPRIGKSTLYNLDKAYLKDKLLGLVPRYKTKLLTGRATFHPLEKYVEMKFPGPPRRNGKTSFLARIRRRWKSPPLEGPIRLSILYSMPIPKGTRMPKRMKMLKGKISHTIKPNLDTLDAFIVDCMTGIVFKNHCQIVGLKSQKEYQWWPQTRVRMKALKG